MLCVCCECECCSCRQLHATPRTDLPTDASKEIADLRRQLEAAHAARRQQAELVRKYEHRWSQLKASAKKKQQAQQEQQAQAEQAKERAP